MLLYINLLRVDTTLSVRLLVSVETDHFVEVLTTMETTYGEGDVADIFRAGVLKSRRKLDKRKIHLEQQ